MELVDVLKDGSIEKVVCEVMLNISQSINKSFNFDKTFVAKYSALNVWIAYNQLFMDTTSKLDASILAVEVSEEKKTVNIKIHKDLYRFSETKINCVIQAITNNLILSKIKNIFELGYEVIYNDVNLGIFYKKEKS